MKLIIMLVPVNRGEDIIDLLKLFAGIENVAHYFLDLQVVSVTDKKTQQLKKQILGRIKVISGINYQR
jgi:hypothetical protein